MSSNYPPGVSGWEPQIAGYDEYESTLDTECWNDECPKFEVTVEADVDVWVDRGTHRYTYKCPTCNQDTDREVRG